MKSTFISVCVLLLFVVLVGCNDSATYPTGDGGWYMDLKIGQFPSTTDEYPVHIDISAQVINLTDGDRPPDGSIIAFETSGGLFENGLLEIQIGTLNGVAETTLQIDRPGRYDLSVEYVEQSTTALTTIIIGIE